MNLKFIDLNSDFSGFISKNAGPQALPLERRALVLALGLALPLVLYGVPYAYASVTSASYSVYGGGGATPHAASHFEVYCNPGDYVTGEALLRENCARWAQFMPVGAPS